MSYLDQARDDAERAPFLFSELPLEVQSEIFKREQTRNDWTAARLFSQKQAIYEVIVRMLGANLPVRLISDFCGVTEKSVVAVREAEPAAVTAFRERMTVRRVNMLHRCADVIAACLEDGGKEAMAKAKDTAIVMNILDGQQRLDQGAPTQIIRYDEPPAVDAYRRYLSELTLDVVSEVTLQTGSERGEAPAKGAEGLRAIEEGEPEGNE